MSVLVIGAGVSGMAAAGLAKRLKLPVTVFDSDSDKLDSTTDAGFATIGPDWTADLTAGHDTIIMSPGIPPHSDIYRDCRSLAISEIEFGFRHASAPVIAVSGTNGKTTVTQAIADVLVASGHDAVACGNIGTALCDVVDQPHDQLVVEVSSFQLYSIQTFRPEVAVLLNVAPDHLDWHGTFEAYAAAKGRITENQTVDDLCIANKNDEVVRELVAFAASRVELVEHADSVETDGGGVDLPRGLDDSFRFDLVAAIRAANAFDIAADATQTWVDGFQTGEHRRQVAGERGDVVFVNDSKATNPHSATAAIRAFSSVVLIAGGRNKDLDLSGLAAARPRQMVLMGESAPDLAKAADEFEIPYVWATDMKDAVRKAADLAQTGDTVLLAPGCTSFDMFDNYKVRGDVFMAEVRDLLEEAP